MQERYRKFPKDFLNRRGGNIMIQRCIMIFPRFKNICLIQEIREKYDPLYKHVEPHITLVFPFWSELSTEELRAHIMESVRGINRFNIKLQGISNGGNGYIFLDIQEGANQIIELHRKLYTGCLEPFYPLFLKEYKYLPHITVGRVQDEAKQVEIVKSYRTFNEVFEDELTTISVEIIDENDDSNIELTVDLQ
jgi:2'-5' RNA ligase